jgi:hypothetical protein
MPINRPLAQFHEHRMGILAMLDGARPLLNDGYAQLEGRLTPFRTELSARMQAFQLYKHKTIFDPILASDSPDRALVEKLKVDCIMLGHEYDAYRQRWAKSDIERDWKEFRLSALAMMTAIRKSLGEQDAAIRALPSFQ